MKIKDMGQAVDLLYDEWDLGKKASESKGKICAWMFLFGILEESETIVTIKDNKKMIGFAGYSNWNSKKHLIRKKICYFIKNILFFSPRIKKKEEIIRYRRNYNYTPEELKDYFDGEISIIIVNEEYRGRGMGGILISKIFEIAKKDGIKVLQILTDESCNFKFYENFGCKKIYETTVPGANNQNSCGETAYIYEKRLGD